MKTVLDDLRTVLYRAAEENEQREDIGLGKNEIHPVAYQLKIRTDGELFDQAKFRSGYRGVRSPEIREILSLFGATNGDEVIKKGARGVDHSDEYFCLSGTEDIEAARFRYDELSDDSKDAISEVIEQVVSAPVEFIRDTNKQFENSIERSQVL